MAHDLAGLVVHRHDVRRVTHLDPVGELALAPPAGQLGLGAVQDEARCRGSSRPNRAMPATTVAGPRSPPIASTESTTRALGAWSCRSTVRPSPVRDLPGRLGRVVVQVDLVGLRDDFAVGVVAAGARRRGAGASARRSWGIRPGSPRSAHHARGACCGATWRLCSAGQPCPTTSVFCEGRALVPVEPRDVNTLATGHGARFCERGREHTANSIRAQGFSPALDAPSGAPSVLLRGVRPLSRRRFNCASGFASSSVIGATPGPAKACAPPSTPSARG